MWCLRLYTLGILFYVVVGENILVRTDKKIAIYVTDFQKEEVSCKTTDYPSVPGQTVDYHYDLRYLFYTEKTLEGKFVIKRQNISKSCGDEVKNIAETSGEIKDIALDWVHNLLFWLQKDKLIVVDLQGESSKTIFSLNMVKKITQSNFDLKQSSFERLFVAPYGPDKDSILYVMISDHNNTLLYNIVKNDSTTKTPMFGVQYLLTLTSVGEALFDAQNNLLFTFNQEKSKFQKHGVDLIKELFRTYAEVDLHSALPDTSAISMGYSGDFFYYSPKNVSGEIIRYDRFDREYKPLLSIKDQIKKMKVFDPRLQMDLTAIGCIEKNCSHGCDSVPRPIDEFIVHQEPVCTCPVNHRIGEDDMTCEEINKEDLD